MVACVAVFLFQMPNIEVNEDMQDLGCQDDYDYLNSIVHM